MPPPSLRDRVLAEALRLREDAGAAPAPGPADAQARAGGGDLEQRLVTRAHLLAGPGLGAALDRTRALGLGLLAGAGIGAAASGAAAMRAALGAEGEVNTVWLLGALLGVQTLLLALWLVLVGLRAGARASVLGPLVLRAAMALGARLRRDADTLAALRAWIGVLAGAGPRPWVLGAITHGLWAAFNLGALLAALALLTLRQYDFVWGSTLLSEATVADLLGAVSWLPARLGFPVPDAETITASRIGALGGGDRQAWSGLLLGALSIHGLALRAAGTVACGALAVRALRRVRLDPALPGYARVAARLQPPGPSLGIVDPAPRATAPRAPGPPVTPGPGAPALVSLELERPDWPAWIDPAHFALAGRADSRAERRALAGRIGALDPRPRAVVVLCSLPRTPDRGSGAFLEQLAACAPLVLVLEEADRLEARVQHPARRSADWRDLAAAAGAKTVVDTAGISDPAGALAAALAALAPGA